MESGDPTMWNFDQGATWSLASGGASEAAELPLGATSACRLVQCEASGMRRIACPTVGIVWFSSLLLLFYGCFVTFFCGCDYLWLLVCVRIPLYFITTGKWRDEKAAWEITCTIIGSAREPDLYNIIMYIRAMDG